MDRPISYLLFDPKRDFKLLPQIVECDRLIFAEEPWNEWKKCSVCGKKWGIDQKHSLEAIHFQHCNKSVVDYWPQEEIFEMFKNIAYKNFCWIALEQDKVIGICWGYPTNIQHLNSELDVEMIDLLKKNKFEYNSIGYLHTICILKKYRGMGIAKVLFDNLLNCLKNNRIDLLVTRTKSNPPTVLFNWLIKSNHTIIYQYNDEDGRVLFVKALF